MHAILEYLTVKVAVSEGSEAQQAVIIKWLLPPQTRVDSFTIEAISRNTELTEKDALSFGAMELPLNILYNNKLFFFLSSCFCGRSAAKYIETKKQRKKEIIQVKLQQLLCHLLQRNPEHGLDF